MSKKLKEKLERVTPEILPELLTPYVEVFSDCRLSLAGGKGILKYSEENIRLNCQTKVIGIEGENLTIACFCAEDITVTGKIETISFES